MERFLVNVKVKDGKVVRRKKELGWKDRSAIVIGSNSACDIHIANKEIDGVHCILLMEGRDRTMLKVFGTKAKTIVNSQMLLGQSIELHSDDLVRLCLGNTSFYFLHELRPGTEVEEAKETAAAEEEELEVTQKVSQEKVDAMVEETKRKSPGVEAESDDSVVFTNPSPCASTPAPEPEEDFMSKEWSSGLEGVYKNGPFVDNAAQPCSISTPKCTLEPDALDIVMESVADAPAPDPEPEAAEIEAPPPKKRASKGAARKTAEAKAPQTAPRKGLFTRYSFVLTSMPSKNAYITDVISSNGGTVCMWETKPALNKDAKTWKKASAHKLVIITEGKDCDDTLVMGRSATCILGLVCRVPILDRHWINECVDKGRIVDFGDHLLGILTDRNKILSQPLSVSTILDRKRFKIVSIRPDGSRASLSLRRHRDVQYWTWIVELLGGEIVSAMKTHYEARLNILFSDTQTLPRRKVAVDDDCGVDVSCSWLIDSILCGKAAIPTE